MPIRGRVESHDPGKLFGRISDIQVRSKEYLTPYHPIHRAKTPLALLKILEDQSLDLNKTTCIYRTFLTNGY